MIRTPTPTRLPDTAVTYAGGDSLTLAGGCDDCAAVQRIQKSEDQFLWTALVWHAPDCPTWATNLRKGISQ